MNRGVLIPSGANYRLFATAVREVWLYGFDSAGETVFVKNVGLAAHYDLTIAGPPPAIEPLERLDLKRRSGLRGSCGSLWRWLI